MSLQRYRINNCADIADDNGGYCLSEDVDHIEKRHSAVISNHIHFSTEEFMAFAAFAMENDSTDQSADMEVIHSMLEQIAVNCLGFDDWIQAYHQL